MTALSNGFGSDFFWNFPLVMAVRDHSRFEAKISSRQGHNGLHLVGPASPARRVVASALRRLSLLESRIHRRFGSHPIVEFAARRKSAPLRKEVRFRRHQF